MWKEQKFSPEPQNFKPVISKSDSVISQETDSFISTNLKKYLNEKYQVVAFLVTESQETIYTPQIPYEGNAEKKRKEALANLAFENDSDSLAGTEKDSVNSFDNHFNEN